MKFQLLALLVVVAGACAKPSTSDVLIAEIPDTSEQGQRIIIEGQIRRIIEQIRQEIRNAGLDPLNIERFDYEDAPIPMLVEIKAFIENLNFNGVSNIAIHNLDYNLLFNRLRFDISLPRVSLSVGDSGIEASVFGNSVDGQLKGSLSIRSIRLSGEVRVNIGIIGGISLRSVSLNFRLGGIESNLSVSVLGDDYSDILNSHLGEEIPKFISDNSASINKRLEDLVREIFNLLTYKLLN